MLFFANGLDIGKRSGIIFIREEKKNYENFKGKRIAGVESNL